MFHVPGNYPNGGLQRSIIFSQKEGRSPPLQRDRTGPHQRFARLAITIAIVPTTVGSDAFFAFRHRRRYSARQWQDGLAAPSQHIVVWPLQPQTPP